MTYLLALDQGTSSSRSIVFDAQGRIVAMAQPPGRRTAQAEAQMLPMPSAGVDDQAPGRPVGAMLPSPGVIEGRTPGTIRLEALPERLQIQPGT